MAKKRIRIRGLVRLANAARRELAGPISAQRLAELREIVEGNIQSLHALFRREGVGPEALPAPSRKALEYLQALDFEAVEPASAGEAPERRPARIRFPGLQADLDRMLDQLAQQPQGAAFDRLLESIRQSSDSVERSVQANGWRPEDLTPQTRAARGWLAYFAERERLESYIQAVARAEPVFRDALERWGREPGRLLLHFRPLKSACRIRPEGRLTRVKMPTEYIAFDAEQLQTLAEHTLSLRRDPHTVDQATGSEACRQIAAEVEWLGGIVEAAAGACHDLAESFDRVNAAYFDGQMPRPRLVWSRTFTFRKFGHYRGARDIVMVSSTLDRSDVPAFAVDFIVYHELLHKQFGDGARGHTPAFRRAERQFRQYQEAQAVLSRLAEMP